jgi:hypothetical protein
MTALDEHAWLRLSQQWRDLVAREEPDAARWGSRLDAMRAQQLRLRAAGQWLHGPSDLISAAGWHRHERFHAAVVRWLLDPGGRHGLGTGFFDHMVTSLWPDLPSLPGDAIDVETEVRHDGGRRRFDIIVRGPEFTVVVEVKVDAPESTDQLLVYWHAHEAVPGVRFVFLAPAGHRMTSAGPSEPHWKPWSFQQIRDFLSTVEPRAEAVNQYLETLRRQFR